jgi:hypothetical protein
VKEVCLKHLAWSQFALQLQPLRLVERPALVRAAQLVLVLVRVRAEQQVLVLDQAQEQVRAQVEQQARVPAQPVQQHSPHQQLQSQCQPEPCHLR